MKDQNPTYPPAGSAHSPADSRPRPWRICGRGSCRSFSGLIALIVLLLALPASGQIISSQDGLIAHWDFQAEDLGLDFSPSARHGIAHGNPAQIVGPSIDEKALELDGASYLEIPNLGEDFNHLPELSVMAWIRVAAHIEKNVFRSQQPVSFASDRFQIRNVAVGWRTLVADPLPPIDTWYHFAGRAPDLARDRCGLSGSRYALRHRRPGRLPRAGGCLRGGRSRALHRRSIRTRGGSPR